VERRHQLRHRRHGDPPRGHEADHAADRDRDADLGRLATSSITKVVTTAISMPAMPKRLPARLDTGSPAPAAPG
jgi:hypothetical protein